jgi:predicted ribosome quality control (RQC) complex YloA/Tae2 family protein
MSLNWKEIDAVLDELSLPGSFIQAIVQPSFDSIALTVYKTEDGRAKIVFIHLGPGVCRIHETRRKITKTDKPLRFMEFLKSRIKGAQITECAQQGKDRIIRMVCVRGQETVVLYIRLWSNAANIIATDSAGVILDTLYRKPKKGEITGATFLPQAITPSKREYDIRDFHELEQAVHDAASDSPQETDTQPARAADLSQYTLNQKIDLWYGQYAETFSRLALLETAEKQYAARHSRMENALQHLEAKRADFLHAEQWKHQGDLILAFGYAGCDTGFLECTDYETGQPIRIQTDPRKNVQENAASYYAVYKKAMSGFEELERDITRAKKELRDLDALYTALRSEQNPVRMRQLIEGQNIPRQQLEKKRPGVTYVVNGWTIFVGRTAAENDELLRRHAKGQDMWLHTRDLAGGYIFIKNKPGKTVPLDILLYAGNLAVHYSKARASGVADIYCTHVKYLRRAKNAPKGTVLVTHEKNLFIKRDVERLKKLEECIVE